MYIFRNKIISLLIKVYVLNFNVIHIIDYLKYNNLK